MFQEKVHESNCSFLSDGLHMQFAKRTAVVADGEGFWLKTSWRTSAKSTQTTITTRPSRYRRLANRKMWLEFLN